jgi:hypothetical protein
MADHSSWHIEILLVYKRILCYIKVSNPSNAHDLPLLLIIIFIQWNLLWHLWHTLHVVCIWMTSVMIPVLVLAITSFAVLSLKFWGYLITLHKVTGSIPNEFIGFFNSSSHPMALGSTQPLTEMSTRSLPGGKGWLACGADNLTSICEPVV